MRELGANLGAMLAASWRADRARSIGALVTTALVPVSRPLRAIGLGVMADGLIDGDRRQALTGIAIVAGLTGANRLFDWASLTVRMRLREHTILHLDQQVMELTAGAPGLEHHERPDHRDRLELLRVDRGYLVNPFMPIAWTLASVVQVAATVLVLAALRPVLGLLPLAGIPSIVIGTRVERWRNVQREAEAERVRLQLHLMELTTQPPAAKEIRVFGLADELCQRHTAIFDERERTWVRFSVRSGVVQTFGWTCFAVAFMAALAIVVMDAMSGRLTVGAVLLTASLGAQINGQLAELVQNTSWFSMTAQAMGRFRWLRQYAADAQAALTPAAPHAVPARLVHGIDFDDVTFAYPGSDAVILRDVNLHLPAGATVAIVGENGAGKTTLVKLLCRFYEPTAGRILVDGVPLRDFEVEDWRQRMSAGFQDFARLQLLARHSVGVGWLPALDDNEEVGAALDRAAAADVSSALPYGLATHLGREFADGVELSLGQWQKIALGRAMMRNEPLVLTLDEPTASLDAATEHALFERFAHAARRVATGHGAITVLVSHRFSTVRMADLIVVVAGGRVVEVGSHEELVSIGGLYAELYNLQARAYR